jgi:hypothetical protein
LQLLEQVKLLIDGIAGLGTRVSMKRAERMVGQAVNLLRKCTSGAGAA